MSIKYLINGLADKAKEAKWIITIQSIKFYIYLKVITWLGMIKRKNKNWEYQEKKEKGKMRATLMKIKESQILKASINRKIKVLIMKEI